MEGHLNRPVRCSRVWYGRQLSWERKEGLTWRIIPVSKWLVTPIYKPFRPFIRGITPFRGLTITMVINHLQVLGWSSLRMSLNTAKNFLLRGWHWRSTFQHRFSPWVAIKWNEIPETFNQQTNPHVKGCFQKTPCL